MSNQPIVKLVDVNKSYGNVYALEDINLDFYPGEIVSLVGDNGAGKSTLTKIISGTEGPDDKGQIMVDNQVVNNWTSAKARARGIETVYQNRALSEQQTIYDNVFLGREITNRFGFINRKKEIEETESLMRKIGYTSKVWTPFSSVNKLSGGERQRVGVVRALMQNPEILLADEPTASLDPKTSEQIMVLLQGLASEMSLPVLINIHNVAQAKAYTDRIVGLRHGQMIFDGGPSDFNSDELDASYGGIENADDDGQDVSVTGGVA